MKFFSFKHLSLQTLAFLLLFSSGILAQAPAGYYSAAEGKTGAALKTALFNIIKGHTDNGYNGLYTTYKTSDNIVINGQSRVYDMYSFKANGTANYYYSHTGGDQCGSYSSEGDCYNREHSMPQSWFKEASPMKSDAHHVVPTDGKVNGMRSNYPHAEVGNATYTSSNGSKLGSCSTQGYSGTVFEPIDEFKGDFARMYMYMATRYEDKIQNWSNNGSASTVLAGNSYPAYKSWYIQLLLKWHQQDPVSTKERERNEAIYARQHNRNPFIDNPDYAEMIWGSGTTNPLSFTSSPVTSATIGFEYAYNIVATSSSSGATLTLTAPTKPSWLTLTPTGNGKATLSGTPTAVGNYPVVIQVTSGSNVKQQSFTITVVQPEATVNFSSVPNTAAMVGSPYTYTVTTNSSTSSYATITAVTKPSWLSLSSSVNGCATLSGTPTADNIGQNNVILRANNGTDMVEQQFVVVVVDSTSGDIYTETFEDMPASSSSYSNISWEGDNNIMWTATNARTDQTLNNRAICLKNSSSTYLQSETLTGGCAFIKLTHQQVFSGSGGKLTVKINGSTVGAVDVTSQAQVDSFTVSVTGSYVIRIESNGAARILIDNLQWGHKTAAALNQKPSISGVTTTPQNPKVGEAIKVFATITDPDGSIASAKLSWGTSQNNLNSTVSMTASGTTYSAQIPAQSVAGTVYFKITATDNSNESSVLTQYISITAVNHSPVISNVSYTPQNPTPDDPVIVTASITDPDSNLSEVTLWWGLEQNSLTNELAMTASGNTYTCTIPAQAANSTVYYRVKATDSAQEESTSQVFSYLVVAVNHSPVISNVSYTPQNPTPDDPVIVTASITDPDNNLSEVILWWGLEQNSLTNELAMTASGNTYTCTIPAQAANSTVYYRVKATDSAQEESTSQVFSYLVVAVNHSPVISNVSYTPQNPTPDDPVIVTASITDPDNNLSEVTLWWGLEQNSLTNELAMTASGNTYTAQIPPQSQNTTIFFRIFAYDSDNASAQSEVYSYIASTTSISDNSLPNVKVYPNPVNSYLTIENTVSIIDRVEIYNLVGCCVFTSSFAASSISIDLNNEPTGVYIVKTWSKGRVTICRIVKN